MNNKIGQSPTKHSKNNQLETFQQRTQKHLSFAYKLIKISILLLVGMITGDGVHAIYLPAPVFTFNSTTACNPTQTETLSLVLDKDEEVISIHNLYDFFKPSNLNNILLDQVFGYELLETCPKRQAVYGNGNTFT